MRKLSSHFWDYEFKCPDKCSSTVDAELVMRLELMRTFLSAPIYVSSGFRCRNWNRSMGRSYRSFHELGKAADIFSPNVSIHDIITAAQLAGFGGIGAYPTKKFVHVDIGGYGRRWAQKNNRPVPYKSVHTEVFDGKVCE